MSMSSRCKDFKACDPPKLFGNKDDVEDLRWMREMEAMIDLSKREGEDVVQFATNLFKGIPTPGLVLFFMILFAV
ncbi:hypothetical protein L1987_64186 [Smallanthus sonchifolius]|uniref:Uncharacterized protein n=1 Tax=Smallanthus sonchifolius TaxID=185202 RepID=A0ACB9CFD4_9ASTR|nr:hypothetical protein L1987_64186 [Smallanthus sonchifolius]